MPVSAHLCTHKILTNSFVTLPKTLATLGAEQRRLPTLAWTTQSTVDSVGQTRDRDRRWRAADVPAPTRTLSPKRHPHTMHTKVSLVCEYLRVGGCTQNTVTIAHSAYELQRKGEKRPKLFVDEVKSEANRTDRRTNRPDYTELYTTGMD